MSKIVWTGKVMKETKLILIMERSENNFRVVKCLSSSEKLVDEHLITGHSELFDTISFNIKLFRE
jgi:hypothetical protein